VTALEEALALVASADLAERCQGVERLAALQGRAAAEALAALLAESSWYLRDRVVEALAARPDARPAVREILQGGSWFARASACDALGRAGDAEALAGLLAAAEDRNVSLQKSAVAAVRRVGEVAGEAVVAAALAGLAPESRRRALTRIAHQEPHWVPELERALASLPSERVRSGPGEAVPPAWSGGKAEVRALARFRRWVSSLPAGGAV
jgi:HEAT repeat protein